MGHEVMVMLRRLFFFFVGILLSIVLMIPYVHASAVPQPSLVVNTVSEVTKQAGWWATQSANSANYALNRGVTVAANAAEFAAEASVNVSKSAVTQSLKQGLATGRINPAMVAGGIVAGWIAEKAIAAGWQWLEEQQAWVKKPLVYDGKTVTLPYESWGIFDPGEYATYMDYCNSLASSIGPSFGGLTFTGFDGARCHYVRGDGGGEKLSSRLTRYPNTCGSGYSYSNGYCILPNVPMTPVTEVDATPIVDDIISTPVSVPDLIRTADYGSPIVLPADSPQTVTVGDPQHLTQPKTISTTTSVNPDGSTSTQTKTEQTKTTVDPATQVTNISSPTINISTQTITNTTTVNPDGTTSTETETRPDEQEEPDIGTVSDSDMPELPTLYEPKYPDGPQGVWNANKPNIETTAFYQGVSSMFPNLGGGQCPAFGIPAISLGGFGNFGSFIFDVPCWIFQAIGLILMTTAAFTARKIIF